MKKKHEAAQDNERSRKHRSPYMTCTSIPHSEARHTSTRSQQHGDQMEKPHEKYLSKKIMTFQWKGNETHMPEKSDLLAKITERIKNNLSPDVTIRIKDKKFECHSIVLTCYMDLSEEIRTIRKDISLDEKFVPYETFAEIYQWMLAEADKSHQTLSRNNVLQLLEAAKYLGVEELENQCWAFINSEDIFNEATALFMYVNAKQIASAEVREPIMQLMLPRIQTFFLILVSSRNWIELNVEDVCALLASNYTRVRCELEMFMSAVRWLQADWNTRQQHVVKVMRCVRFGLMSPFHLVQIRQSPEFNLITTHPGVQKLIIEGMDVATVNSSHALVGEGGSRVSTVLGLREPLPRRFLKHDDFLYDRLSCIYSDFLAELNSIKEGKVVLNDSDTSSHDSLPMRPKSNVELALVPELEESTARMSELPTDVLEADKVKNIAKDHVIKMPGNESETSCEQNFNNLREKSSCQVNLSACTVGKSLPDRAESAIFMEESEAVLVFGGVCRRAPFEKQKEIARQIHRYNPFVNTWQLVDKMPAARQYHCTVYHQDLVYVAGGVDVSTDSICKNLWSFNPTNKQWTLEADMLHARKNFNMISCVGKIFAIGGLNTSGLLCSVECYDPGSHKWCEVASLREPRMGLAAAEVNGRIWIAGGHNGVSVNPLSDQVECYDPSSNSWISIQPKLRYPRYMASLVCVDNEKLYLIGGAACDSNTSGEKMSSVSDLDVLELSKRREWRCVSELAQPRHGHSTSMLSTQILIIGGVTTVFKKPVKSVECWCFKRQAWIQGISGLMEPIVGHSSLALPCKSP